MLEEPLMLMDDGRLSSTYTALMYVYSKVFNGSDFNCSAASDAAVGEAALHLALVNLRLLRKSGGEGS